MTTIGTDRTRSIQAVRPASPVVETFARERLLDVARSALRVATRQSPAHELSALVERRLAREIRAAVFVTLTRNGHLRGCIGTLDPGRRLEEAVARAATSAAVEDPRFLPVQADELPGLRIDISILGAPVELVDLSEFVPGVDGVIVERDGRRALLLPEVATDQDWDGRAMLTAACHKAGLRGDAWRDLRTSRLVFRTVRFGGPAVEVAWAPEALG